ncbi:MAG: DNA translocase FtsK [Candidatus Limnocylindria bacterium]
MRKSTDRAAVRRPARSRGAGLEGGGHGEIAGIALLVFALLSAVALVADQGALLHWWRASLFALLGWGAVLVPPGLALVGAAVAFPSLRPGLVAPAAAGTVLLVAVLGLLEVAVRSEPGSPAGGMAGGLVGGSARSALGDVGAALLLIAIALVALVVASGRSAGELASRAAGFGRWVADLARAVILRRPRFVFRPGATLPGGTGTAMAAGLAKSEAAARERRADAESEAEDAIQQPLRINLQEERAPRAAGSDVPATAVALPVAAAPAALGPAGLASAAVAAEGVLHATADRSWSLPSIDLLEEGSASRSGRDEVMRNTRVIEETLLHFNIVAKVVEVSVGPVVTRYELKPAAGVKLSRIEALSDDLSLALAARSLRIEAPVPGKSVVGIEIPNLAIGLVSLRDVAETATFVDATSTLTVACGRDVAGSPIVLDLAKLPHLLVAGQTGSGKSVCISSMICSLLMNSTPDRVRLLIGDLKRVDFTGFNGLPHLVVPIMTEHDKILNALYWVTGEMDRRYRLFARASARNIASYNESRSGPDKIPYIVFIIDELADLMLQAPIQVEKQITRVAQLARATGIHLVLGTQRPSVDVITGLIKANIPARIAFATASSIDSRTILDMTGAEKLLGRGDMLVLPPDKAKPIRAQGVFVSDRDIAAVTAHWKAQGGLDPHPEVLEDPDKGGGWRDDGGDGDIDDARYEEAVDIVKRAGQASVSMLQRKMTVGFARAGRLIDVMEQHGVIGPAQGPGKMREVYGGPPPRRTPDEDGDA